MEEKMNIEPVDLDVVKEKSKAKAKTSFKTKECEIVRFVSKDCAVEINFDGIVIRFNNVKKDYTGKKTVKVKYKGNVGKPKFTCTLDE